MRTGGFLARTAASGCLIAAMISMTACAPETQRFEPTLAEAAPSPDATAAVAAVPKSLVTIAAKKTAPVPKPVVRRYSGGSSGGSGELTLAQRRALAQKKFAEAKAMAERNARELERWRAAQGY